MNTKDIVAWTLINVIANVLATVLLYYLFRNKPSINTPTS